VLLDCNQILPDRLWVGSYVTPDHVKELKLMGITTVLSMQTDEEIEHLGIAVRKLVRAYRDAGIAFCRTPARDFDEEALLANLPACVSELENLLQERWSRVYLHCTAGINRSPTAAAAFLVKARGLSAGEACQYVAERRHCKPYLPVLERYAALLDHVR
jgi:protein-tyrosine phosphatase